MHPFVLRLSLPVCSLFALALLIPAPGAEAAASVVSSATARDLPQVARSVPRGARMRIEATTLDGVPDPAGIDMVRFEPVAEHARFVVQTDAGPRDVTPDLPVYFRGAVDGMRGSIAVLSVRRSGELRGVVSGADGTWMLSRKAGGAETLRSRRVERQAFAAARKFSCEVMENPGAARTAAPSAPAARAGVPRLPVAYTAQIAVELDYDYYTTFSPDADAAILYALDLLAFTGTIGESELGMNVQVPFLTLWTTPVDPYSAGDARLGQVRTRWNQAAATNCGGTDCTTIDRSTVLLLSSAATGGAAYVPALCDSWHDPTGGYSYAYAGSIGGTFDIDNPAPIWDVIATAHELGHNFGSNHTHCYSPPVDHCFANDDGCYAGPTSLPSGCPGSGQGCASLMSYCHLLTGGKNNIALSYGAGLPYGDTPDRVPNVMIDRIALEAAAAPGCLAITDGMVDLRVTKAGSGSGTVTSSPSGIDCGTTCRTWADANTMITLTATPSTFSSFTGWSGDPDCSDGVVTLAASTSCTATFDGSCGAGNEDCDDGNPCTVDSCPLDDHCENAGTPRDPMTCLQAVKTRLKLSNSADPSKDKFNWDWTSGAAFDQADLGLPSSQTDYRLCVYDTTGGVPSLATSLWVPGGSAGWRNFTPKGWRYLNSFGTNDGIRKLQLKPGIAGKSKIKLTAAGSNLPLPAPDSLSEFFDQDTTVIVQLRSSDDECWTSSFAVGTGTRVNTPAAFKSTGN